MNICRDTAQQSKDSRKIKVDTSQTCKGMY